MALQVRQRSPLISVKLAGVFLAIFAFIIQSAVMLNLPVAFAATPAIDHISFTTSSQTILPNATSSVITIQTQNHGNQESKLNTNQNTLTVESDSSTGQFAETGGSVWSAPGVFTMAKNTANKNFIYKDTTTGVHTLTATLSTDNGADEWTATQTIAVFSTDTTKPTATLLTPAVDSYNPSEIIVEAHDETSLDRVTGNLYDGANVALIKSCSASAAGAKDYTLHCTLPTLSNGTYTVRANARDEAGHVSTTISRQFKVDHTNPTVTLKSSSVGSMSDNVFSKADFKLHDNDKVKGYSINVGTFYSVTPDAWSDANDIRVGVRGAVYGDNTITVEDMAGNTGSLDFTLDNIGPDISVKPESVGTESAKRFSNVSFKLHDKYKVDKLTLNGHVKDLSNNAWSDFNNVTPGKYGAAEGENTLEVYDVAGNKTTYMFTLDTESPSGTFTFDPSNNVVKKSPVTVTLTTTEPIKTPSGWTKSDNMTFTKQVSGNGKYYVTLEDLAGNSTELMYEVKRIDDTLPVIGGVNDGDIRNTNLAGFTVTDQNFESATVDGSAAVCSYTGSSWVWNCPGVSGEGIHTITATDKAGNSKSVQFEIDMTAPTLSNLTYVQNDDNSFTLSVVTNDPAAVTFRLDGTEIPGATTQDNGDGTWTWLVVTDVLALNSNHSFSARSTDSAGNPSTISGTFSVAPPTTSTIGDSTSTIDQRVSNAVTVPTANLFATTGDTGNTADEDTSDEGEVLGAQDSSSPVNDSAALLPSEEGWKVFGVAWYWWLAGAAALGGGWWMIAALRRHQASADPSAGL